MTSRASSWCAVGLHHHCRDLMCTCGHHDRRVVVEEGATVVEQPPPVPNDSTPIVDLVVADLAERKAEGVRRYGVPLQAGNGRDALRDAYEEAMDLTCYLRQVIAERDRATTVVPNAMVFGPDTRAAGDFAERRLAERAKRMCG